MVPFLFFTMIWLFKLFIIFTIKMEWYYFGFSAAILSKVKKKKEMG